MKKKVLSLLAFLPAFTTVMAQQTAEVPDVCAFVNPIIGTNGMGHTFPGACAPFGLVQLSPDTDTIPHNIDGTYQKKMRMNIVPDISIMIRQLWDSAIPI